MRDDVDLLCFRPRYRNEGDSLYALRTLYVSGVLIWASRVHQLVVS